MGFEKSLGAIGIVDFGWGSSWAWRCFEDGEMELWKAHLYKARDYREMVFSVCPTFGRSVPVERRGQIWYINSFF